MQAKLSSRPRLFPHCPPSIHSRPSFLFGDNKADRGFRSLSSLYLYFATPPSAPSSSLHHQFTMTSPISTYIGKTLKRVGEHLSPTRASSSQSHCPGCICHTLPPDLHPDDADLFRDAEGNPWDGNTLPVTLKYLAQELTLGPVENRHPRFDQARGQRRFACLASQASGKHDFGIPYDPHNDLGSEMKQVIITLAWVINEMGDPNCPSRSDVMDHLQTKLNSTVHRSLYEHLQQVDAAQKAKTLSDPCAAWTPDSVPLSKWMASLRDSISGVGSKGETEDPSNVSTAR